MYSLLLFSIYFLLFLDISTPGSWAFRLKINYATGFPGSLADRWHMVGLPGFYINNQLLIISLPSYLSSIGSGEP